MTTYIGKEDHSYEKICALLSFGFFLEKRNNFCDFLFAFLDREASLK